VFILSLREKKRKKKKECSTHLNGTLSLGTIAKELFKISYCNDLEKD